MVEDRGKEFCCRRLEVHRTTTSTGGPTEVACFPLSDLPESSPASRTRISVALHCRTAHAQPCSNFNAPGIRYTVSQNRTKVRVKDRALDQGFMSEGMSGGQSGSAILICRVLVMCAPVWRAVAEMVSRALVRPFWAQHHVRARRSTAQSKTPTPREKRVRRGVLRGVSRVMHGINAP